MDGLLEKFVPGGYRGVQLMAYSWELADNILSVGGGCMVKGPLSISIQLSPACSDETASTMPGQR